MAQGHFGRALASYRSARLMFYNALEITWQRALESLNRALSIGQIYSGGHACGTNIGGSGAFDG